MMIGGAGRRRLPGDGRRYSEYENSIGTGQVHVWFDRPDGGFPRSRTYAEDSDVRQKAGPRLAAAG